MKGKSSDYFTINQRTQRVAQGCMFLPTLCLNYTIGLLCELKNAKS